MNRPGYRAGPEEGIMECDLGGEYVIFSGRIRRVLGFDLGFTQLNVFSSLALSPQSSQTAG